MRFFFRLGFIIISKENFTCSMGTLLSILTWPIMAIYTMITGSAIITAFLAELSFMFVYGNIISSFDKKLEVVFNSLYLFGHICVLNCISQEYWNTCLVMISIWIITRMLMMKGVIADLEDEIWILRRSLAKTNSELKRANSWYGEAGSHVGGFVLHALPFGSAIGSWIGRQAGLCLEDTIK